ncbi:MAG: GNAT family N-acetyltransferase [Pyrinomonadaceae bacterium]|nr:GNAT family N-acetyltransferase [Phycisphaerales bacterium]
MGSQIDLRAFVSHLDRQNRLTIPLSRDCIVTCEAGGAWLTRDSLAEGEFPSSNLNRVHWIAADTPLRSGQIQEALKAMRSLGARRFFAWIGPLAWDEQSHAKLEASGGTPWTYVRNVVLMRAAGVCEVGNTLLHARSVEGTEIDHVLGAIAPWYKERGVAALRRLLANESFELHAAFENATPVAIAAYVADGEWAHFGWAGTDPAHQRQGAQTALIYSRLGRAHDRGARHCVAEINTTHTTSLDNLKRCGFQEAFDLRVYGWQAGVTQ